jgi:hypothetical protein
MHPRLLWLVDGLDEEHEVGVCVLDCQDAALNDDTLLVTLQLHQLQPVFLFHFCHYLGVATQVPVAFGIEVNLIEKIADYTRCYFFADSLGHFGL